MKKVFGYTRVSTVKQGNGVSLIEQKEAISRYAVQNNLDIVEWFEEKETAAKQGRRLFSIMMKKLKKQSVRGVIIHKIDRSARNLKDWAELGDLIDQGIEVHFAHESLDMNARGGRLSADIQAVIASDYIRNLRQETIKGLYGRLKQGVYPFKAPVGYKDNGAGKVKTIDPIQGPLVKKTFELYATKKYTLEKLRPVMFNMGLRNIKGKKFCINGLATLLHNPFYIGIIKIKKTGQSYKGGHEPLISSTLFDKVQDIFTGRANKRGKKHSLLFSKKIACSHCGYTLIGEVQKGHIYYRCHTKSCPTTGLRESYISKRILEIMEALQIYDVDDATLTKLLEEAGVNWSSEKQGLLHISQIQLGQLNNKLERLTDAYLDGALDKETYERRKEQLLREIVSSEAGLKRLSSPNDGILQKIKEFLELAKSLKNSYERGNPEEKMNLVEMVTSNLSALGKNLEITLFSPFYELFQRVPFLCGPPLHGQCRKDTPQNADLAISSGFRPRSQISGDSRTHNTKIIFSDKDLPPQPRAPLTEDQCRLFLNYLIDFYRSTECEDENKT